MLADLRAFRGGEAAQTALSLRGLLRQLLRQPRFSIPIVIIFFAIAASVTFWMKRSAKAEWARQELLPKIEQLAEDIDWSGGGPNAWQAYKVALQSAQYIPNDPLLNRLLKQVSRYVKIYSNPTGAKIYVKPYA